MARHRRVRARSWLDRGLDLVLVLVLVTALGSVGAWATGWRLMVEASDSMRPTLSSGDLLLSRSVALSGVEDGDVVSFQDASRSGRSVTHRVVVIEPVGRELAVTTRGDANTATESWTASPTARVGLYVTHVDGLGRVMVLLRSPAFLAALAVVAILGAGGLVLPSLLRRGGRLA